MKLATILSFVTAAAAAALPAATNNIAARASYSKVDGLKFNIDGVTKCMSLSANSPTPTNTL
jgi:mannan endo-1,4-beta-mannosidase